MVAATLPAIIVLLTFHEDLRVQRDIAARTAVQHKAELVNLAMGSVVDGVSLVMTAIGSRNSVRGAPAGCDTSLDDLRSRLQPYVFLTVLHADGSNACGDSLGNLPGLPDLARRAASQGGVVIGHYDAAGPGLPKPFLSIAQVLPGQPPLVMAAGISLDWISEHLAALHGTVRGRIAVSDSDGTVLAMVPAGPGPAGGKLPAELLPFVMANQSGTAVLSGGGRSELVGYVPSTLPPKGMFVAYMPDESDLNTGTDRIAMNGYLLIAIGAVLSLLLALLAGNWLVRIPTIVLLHAARRWGEGDLTARAVIPFAAAAEFQRLGSAFNDMAEMLKVQRGELHALNDALELRVAERTRALLESNNRLQVEIAERELTESSLRQDQKLQAVGQLAGGIAHSFNNLLTAVLGSLELLRKRLSDDNPRHMEPLDAAAEAVARGSRLTSQLLDFSRKQPLQAVPTDLTVVVATMGGLLSSTLGPAVRVELRLAPDLWPALLDKNQFEAAVLNLALNARDAMPDGGRLLIAATNTTVAAPDATEDLAAGAYLRVVVADSGRGIDPSVLGRVFEPFFTTRAADGASGLGLSQVHGMVRQSGGDVQIESTPGDGTRVIMLLPRSALAPDPAGPSRSGAITPALSQQEAILLVDDDVSVSDVTAAMLNENGYQVVTAADGLLALEALHREGARIQLVIADYAMPGMSGRELLTLIRRERPDLPLLLATGYADYDVMTADGLPADQIIRKPFRSAELLARIHMVRARAARPAPDV